MEKDLWTEFPSPYKIRECYYEDGVICPYHEVDRDFCKICIKEMRDFFNKILKKIKKEELYEKTHEKK